MTVKNLIAFLIAGSSLCVSSAVFAINSTQQSTSGLSAQLKQIRLETQQLQREEKALRAKLNKIQGKKYNQKKAYGNNRGKLSAQRTPVPVLISAHPKQHNEPPPPEPTPAQLEGHNRFLRNIFEHYITVTTSPFIGRRSAYDASDLLEQAATMNEDLRLLEQRALLQQEVQALGYSLEDRGILEISGGIEGQWQFSNGFNGQTNDSINLSTAELDLNAVASDWANAFFSIDYDSSPTTTGNRVPNSRIYLRRGFITIGNLNVEPVYFTMGQFYMPFGRYASFLLTTPLTASMAQTLARGALIGVITHGFYAQLYGFHGSELSMTQTIFARQYGGNVGYRYAGHQFKFHGGVGAISTLADSLGMQSNGVAFNTFNTFQGFGQPVQEQDGDNINTVGPFNNLKHRVPGIDGHTEITFDNISFYAEYLSALCRFNSADMTFNGHGALPAALHVELGYTIHFSYRPLTVALAYGQTWQALALNLPEQSYAVVLSTSFWKDTIEALEYRHDVNYSSGDRSTGAGFNGPPSGGSRDIVTFQIGAYF